MKRKHMIGILLSVLLLGAAGYQLVCGGVLLMHYMDRSAGVTSMMQGMIYFGIFLVILYFTEITQRIQKHMTKKDQEKISLLPIKSVRSILIPCVIVSLVIIVVTLLGSYHAAGIDGISIAFTAELFFLGLLFLVSRKNYRKAGFVAQVISMKQELINYTQENETSNLLLAHAKRSRIKVRAICITAGLFWYGCFLFAFLTKKGSIVSLLASLFLLFMFCIFLRAGIIRTSDRMIIQTLDEGDAKSALAMLLAFYEEKKAMYLPAFNMHTFVIVALYDQGQYAYALQLLPQIKIKNNEYQLYLKSLQVLCEEGVQDREGILETMKDMKQLQAQLSNQSSKIIQNSLFIYQCHEAMLQHDEKQMEELIRQSEQMSTRYQEIASRIQKDMKKRPGME